MNNVTVRDNGATSKLYGGAINMKNSDIKISNSSFESNTAQTGGAIYFTCTSLAL